MEKTDRETHDFMNVQSFSQLPFIRPSPLKEKSIRLFGKEFGGDGSDSVTIITADDYDTNNEATTPAATATHEQESSKDQTTTENSRKFECHYCCRNFPTSQALGGHQNAHKRERQHAKRAHLQSTMVHGSFSDAAQMYGLMNYHRFTATTPSPQPPYYHHHNHTTNYNNRFYGNSSHSHHQTPINGSPLALWRSYPNPNNNTNQNTTFHSMNASPLLSSSNDHGLRAASRIHGSSSYMYDSKPNVQDQVSLDLHL